MRKERDLLASPPHSKSGGPMKKPAKSVFTGHVPSEQLQNLIVTDENRYAFERICDVAESREPTMLYICAPTNSGKTILLQSRMMDLNLLASANIHYSLASDILLDLSIDYDLANQRLAAVGTCETLFLDNLDDFFANQEFGTEAARLLIEARNAQGLNTVIASRTPLWAIEDEGLRNALAGFEEIILPESSRTTRTKLARAYAEQYLAENNHDVTFSDDALDYIANDFAKDMRGISTAMMFLSLKQDFPEGHEISLGDAKAALVS